MSSYYSDDTYQRDKIRYEDQPIPKPSGALVYGGLLAFLAGLLLLISFASPYWLQSYEETHTPFKNMGLWEFCFDNFRFPRYQFDRKFTGCHYVFSEEYRIIREWLLPGWLITTQAFMTLAFVASYTAQILISLSLMRAPLYFIMRNEHHLAMASSILLGIAAFTGFLSVAIFGGKCWTRDWLRYPNFNYLSWSYMLAIISVFVHILSCFFLIYETRQAEERKRRSNNLVMHMQRSTSEHGYI